MKLVVNSSPNSQVIWDSTEVILLTSTPTKACNLTINTIDLVCQIVLLVVIKDLLVWGTTRCSINLRVNILELMDLHRPLVWECITHILDTILQWALTSTMVVISMATAPLRETINGINHLSKTRMGVEITTISRASSHLNTQH